MKKLDLGQASSSLAAAMVFAMLAYSPISVDAQVVQALMIENTEQLLARVQAAPRLPLEISQLGPNSSTEAWDLGMVSSVAIGPDELIYVLHRNIETDPVVVLNAAGEILRSWGNGLYVIPHSIRIDREGNVWTVDAGNSQIYKFSPDGNMLLQINVGEIPEAGSSRFRGTADIAFSSDGNLFIADGYGNARVLEYGRTGERIREWGTAGNGPGEFHLVHGIAVDDNDIVYVADRENGRVQRFTRDGEFLGLWDGLGKVFALYCDADVIWIGTQRFDYPNGSVGWVMQLDRDSGGVVGIVAVPSVHSISVTKTGEVLTGVSPNRVLWYRRIPGV